MAQSDPDLFRAVDALRKVSFDGTAYRHAGPRHSPTSGEGARIRGGRWNPPESFPTLYLALSEETVAAEFYRLAERQGMPAENLLPRRLDTFAVELHAVLDLRRASARKRLGLTDRMIRNDDPAVCQRIGEAAHAAGFEAILAPSATGVGTVLALFTDRLDAHSNLAPSSSTLWEALPPRSTPA